jgi:hypothetical protein
VDPAIATIMTIATVTTVILGAVLTIKNVIAPMWRGFKKALITWEDFITDWKGDPNPEDGRKPTIGVIARLEIVEDGMSKLEKELTSNGGMSVKDVVNRIETRLEEGSEKFDSLDTRLSHIERTIES